MELDTSKSFEVDYYCYDYVESQGFYFFLIKIPETILSDIAINKTYLPAFANFIFEIKHNIVVSNIDNNFHFHINDSKDSICFISGISSDVLKHWHRENKLIFKFVRQKEILINSEKDLEEFSNDDLNTIGVIAIN